MTNVITDPLHALDRLNSWLRSPSYGLRIGARPRNAVYAMKLTAIGRALQSNSCSLRRVHVTVACRDCEGGGCQSCREGRVKLRFVESTISDIAWHTPEHRWPYTTPFDWSEDAHGWTVNRPGVDLPVEEVARLLNIAEEAYAPKEPGDERFEYSFLLGYAAGDSCRYCGAEDSLFARFAHGRLHWRQRICWTPACRDRWLANTEPPPEELTSSPHIQEWLRRHQSSA